MSNAEGEMYRLEEENDDLKAQVERLELEAEGYEAHISEIQARVNELEETVDQEINSRLEALGQVERLESLVKKITYDQSTVELGYGEQVVFNIAYPMGGTVHKEVQDVWKTKDEGVPMIDRVSRDLEKYESLVKDDKWGGQVLMSVASLREIKATERILQAEVESLREENESLKEEIISLQEDNAGESI